MADGAVAAERGRGEVTALIEAIWVASALVATLEPAGCPDSDAAAEVLAYAGLAERAPKGWALTPSAAAEIDRRSPAIAAALRSALAQAAAIAAGTAGCSGWARYDDDVL